MFKCFSNVFFVLLTGRGIRNYPLSQCIVRIRLIDSSAGGHNVNKLLLVACNLQLACKLTAGYSRAPSTVETVVNVVKEAL